MPLDEYLDSEKRQEVEDFYTGPQHLKVNGISYGFRLLARPYYEVLGIALKNWESFGMVGATTVIDMGSLNTNIITFSKKKPVMDKSRCTKEGMGKLFNDINRILARKFELHREPDSVVGAMVTGEAEADFGGKRCANSPGNMLKPFSWH
ncbi:MAG: hypothetical protein FWF59_11530 [Turicibacter sp.]|nr:hypothetical protein [Turicibacter sp.]